MLDLSYWWSQPVVPAVPPLQTYSQLIMTHSPVAYWRLGDPSGTTATDSSGNGRNGTYRNTPTLAVAGAISGDADTAVTFARASSEDVSIPDNAAFSPTTTGALTVIVWVDPNATNHLDSIIAKGNGTNFEWEILRINDGTYEGFYAVAYTDVGIGLAVANGATETGYEDGPWYCVAGVWVPHTSLILYVNGVEVVSDLAWDAGVMSNTTSDVYIASRNSEMWFNGSVDEVSIHPTALTAPQLLAIYNKGIGA